ncbi:sensor domain-containing protein [Phytomonospora sp. NPDC050363]|uniref:sensor domain-containing protein n=1 Tax=Phytomonospora sp. NPDC050363 TaxID=3155642 RepID=UPI00340A51A3
MTNPTAATRIDRPAGRLEMLATAFFLLPIAVLGTAVFSIMVTGLSLAVLWIGIPVAMTLIYFTRHLTDMHRLWFGSRYGVRIARPYRELPDTPGFGGHFKRFLALLADPQTWRDQAWLLINATVGVAILSTIVAIFAAGMGALSLFVWFAWLPEGTELTAFGIPGFMTVHDTTTAMTFGIPAGVSYLAIWWVVTPYLIRAHAHLARVLLGDRQPVLAQRVDRMAEMLAN